MSIRRRRICGAICVGWVLVFFSLDALAAGGESAQGVLLAGQGIDWQRSGTKLQTVPVLTGPSFPPKAGDKFSVGAATIEVQSCVPGTSKHHARCDVMAAASNATDPSSLFCGLWLSGTAMPLNLLVLNAKQEDGRFMFDSAAASPNKNIVFACGAKNPAKVQEVEWAALGAIGKCILWPSPISWTGVGPSLLPPPSAAFPPADAETDRFDSCVRAVRADYCGKGVPYTKDNTRIDLYDKSPPEPHKLKDGFLLEAIWDKDGAICVIHARYVSLSPECQKKTFPIVVSLFGERGEGKGAVPIFRGSEYHCRRCDFRPDKCDPTGECAKLKAFQDLLSKGVLMDDSLLQP
jgi:ADYC domain